PKIDRIVFSKNTALRLVVSTFSTSTVLSGSADRMSTFLLAGPPPPGPPRLWQATQELSLKTGPRPSPPWLRGSLGSHSRRKSSRPSASSSAEGVFGAPGSAAESRPGDVARLIVETAAQAHRDNAREILLCVRMIFLLRG